MLIRAPYLLSFILVACCWFKLNGAIPFASRPSEASRTRHTLKDKQIDSQRYDITTQSRTLRNAEDLSDSSSSDGAKRINKIRDQNINLIFGHHTSNYKEDKQNIPKKIPLFYRPQLKPLENIYEEKQSANCSSGKKEYQRYSSSFDNVTNRALTIDKEFKQVVGNNSKVKTSSSVHEDEDISVCWIETTTIKENKTVRPLKKLLVIREYTISFENSATIPDEYLECKKFEGESTNDNDIGKTALFEIIDENTKVSRVVDFTSVSHVGDVTVWQHKKVKCGVGPVISKNVIEWNDGSKIPKKRVEIKVSPKIKTVAEEICTESSTKDKKSSKPTTESRENAESGTCEVTTKSNDISENRIEISLSEERATESKEADDESEEDQNMSTGITKPFLLPVAELFTTTIFPTLLITKKDILSCEEDSSDPLCKQKNITQSSSSREVVIESGVTEEFPQIITVEKELSSSSESGEKELPVTTPENIDFSTQEVDFTTSRVTEKKEEERLISEKDKDTISIELSSEKLNTIDYVPSSSINTITSNEIGKTTQDVTVTVSPYGFIEFAKESEKFNSVLNKLTELSISTESGITESFTEIKQTASSSTISNGIIDYSCENSEECASANSPESCNENCGSEIVKSCESGICSTEETEESITVLLPTKNQSFTIDSSDESTTTLSPQEIENYATINNVVTRRSTTRRSLPQHKLTLKVKVLLEHIDENEEKHNLVEIEKQLSFNEDSERRYSDLLKQLKFLNKSVNREILSALLNYTSLNNLTKKITSTLSNEAIDDSHTDDKIEEKSSITDSPYNTLEFSTKEAIHPSTTINNLESETSSTTCVENEKNITKGENDSAPFLLSDTDYDTNLTTLKYQNVNVTQESILSTTTNNPEEETSDTLRTESDTTEIILNIVPSIKENIGNETKIEIVRQTLSGIQEDISFGLQHIVSKLAQSNLTLVNNTEKIDQTNLPGVTADHKADKIHSRIRRAAEEEIGYWSNERVREGRSMGGNLRSITEITLYKIFS